jgi:hypothetical protein
MLWIIPSTLYVGLQLLPTWKKKHAGTKDHTDFKRCNHIPSLHDMQHHLVFYSLAAYSKHAPFMRMTDECLLTYRSPDYLPEIAVPLRPAARGSHIFIQTLHPLFANWAAMLQRTSATHLSHHNVQVESCWEDSFWPGHCDSKDEFAFFSYVTWVDYILGTKPNRSHSSSSLFCVDRVNVALHYSIDNIRWASNATNFWNKGPQTSSSATSSSINSSILSLRRLRDVVRKLKLT